MKNKLRLLPMLLMATSGCFAQQTIVAFRGREIPAEVLSKDGDTIRYRNTENGKEGKIAKSLTWKIQNQTGPAEYFFTDEERNMPIEELRARIKNAIEGFAYEEDSNVQRYKVEFEGDHIRLPIVKGNKVKHKGLLFNFGQVYQFHPVSKRGDESYVNIYVDFQNDPKKLTWKKRKLIMKIKGHKEGDEIMRLLQVYNHRLTT